jgi:hypothetical protein
MEPVMYEFINLFDSDPFSLVTMTTAINKRPYVPMFLESLGIFTPTPIRTEDAAVVIDDSGAITIIPTTVRGAPPIEQVTKPQSIRRFTTPRVAIGDTIRSSELQNIIARSALAGGSAQMMISDLQSEMAYRLDGPGGGLRGKQNATKERMRLGAISGLVLDADDSVLYDWPTLFGVSLPAEIDFNLDASSPVPGALTTLLRQTNRLILRAAKAGNLSNVSVLALCGDAFFDAFVTHPDVITKYQFFTNNGSMTSAAGNMPNVPAFSLFNFAEIDWVNYRGTDDNTTIKLDTNKCKFIPRNIPGLFQEVLSPGEDFQSLNEYGLPLYTMVIPDRDRNQYVRLETYSYPMYVATRPEVLFSGKLT